MLHVGRAAESLERKLAGFTGYDRGLSDDLEAYRRALASLAGRSAAEIRAGLGAGASGALPSEEWDAHRRPVLPFGVPLAHHEEARAWAAEALFDRTTFAADGSQIQPSPDLSVPVAVVQVGWFENPHNPALPYVKDVRVEVLTPDEVAMERNGVADLSEQAVHRRRFALEVDALCDWMHDQAGVRPLPVAFFDSSLVASFAEDLDPESRAFYVERMVRLVAASEDARVPLVGYVDNSRARDLATMLSGLDPSLPRTATATDAEILHGVMRWGERTPAWVCDREGTVLRDYTLDDGERDLGDRLCFLYLKTSAQTVPARLDIPRWVVEEGHVDDVVGIVRAEAVVGNGYPYAIETADATAVITMEDRRRFYALFERFAARNGIGLRVASKIQSKARRR